eukprot:m.15169 g.15169  ORF g.15169 m.15169 type:complete len:280 (+) comp7818_c0_seq1:87-926(+)
MNEMKKGTSTLKSGGDGSGGSRGGKRKPQYDNNNNGRRNNSKSSTNSDSLDRYNRVYSKLPKVIASQLQFPVSGASNSKEEATQLFEDMMENSGEAKSVVKTKLGSKVVMLDSMGVAQPKTTSTTTAGFKHLPTLNRKRKKQCAYFQLPEEAKRYELYVPLHKLWTQYISEAVGLSSPNVKTATLQQAILKADLHGCKLCVTRSRKPSLVGRGGIVLQETENTFRVITEQNSILMIPKKDSVFSFELRNFVFTIFGNQYRIKPAERISRKFKAKATLDL